MKSIKRLMNSIKLLAGLSIAVAAMSVLAACGSGGGSSSSSGSSTTVAVPHSISGKATSGGAALAGVTVSLVGKSNATATTDANGTFTFSGLADGQYVITPSKTGYTFDPSGSAQGLSGANISNVNFTASQTTVAAGSYSISGKVTAFSDGSNLPYVAVTLVGSVKAATVTDLNGAYSFSALPNGTYTLTPSVLNYPFEPASSNVTINGQSLSGVNFLSTSNDHTTHH